MTDLTLAQMEAAGQKAAKIKQAIERLKEARRNLGLLDRAAEMRKKEWRVDESWKPKLVLRPATGGYGEGEIAVPIELPFPLVQQQLVDAVKRAYREVILLGGPCDV